MVESQIPTFNIAEDIYKQVFFVSVQRGASNYNTEIKCHLLYSRSTEWPQVTFFKDLSPDWFIEATLSLCTN